jgi:bacterioferritin-associated ferredoxin
VRYDFQCGSRQSLFARGPVKLDDTICYCFHVPKRKILNFIRIHQPRRASQISECGGAGTGCGWCVPYLKRYFEEAQAGKAEQDELTPEEYERMRADYIREGKGTPPPGAAPLSPQEAQ